MDTKTTIISYKHSTANNRVKKKHKLLSIPTYFFYSFFLMLLKYTVNLNFGYFYQSKTLLNNIDFQQAAPSFSSPCL